MSKFPKTFGPDIAVTEIDLDLEDVRLHGERLDEARAEGIAADILSRTPTAPAAVTTDQQGRLG